MLFAAGGRVERAVCLGMRGSIIRGAFSLLSLSLCTCVCVGQCAMQEEEEEGEPRASFYSFWFGFPCSRHPCGSTHFHFLSLLGCARDLRDFQECELERERAARSRDLCCSRGARSRKAVALGRRAGKEDEICMCYMRVIVRQNKLLRLKGAY